jgi:hypothetical protein
MSAHHRRQNRKTVPQNDHFSHLSPSSAHPTSIDCEKDRGPHRPSGARSICHVPDVISLVFALVAGKFCLLITGLLAEPCGPPPSYPVASCRARTGKAGGGSKGGLNPRPCQTTGKLADQRMTIHLGRPLARSGQLQFPSPRPWTEQINPIPSCRNAPAVDATGERGVTCGPKCCWAWKPIPDI